MKMFGLFFALFAMFVVNAVKIVSAIFDPVTYEPVRSTIRAVFAQVIGIKYINDKMPCSATGGTA